MSDSAPSNILAGPMGDCCTKGLKHEGEAVGRTEDIAGFQTYISEPPADTKGTKKIILYFADVYGPFYINAQLLQDYFARQGFLVLGVDYLFGDYVQEYIGKEGFDLAEWATKKFGVAQKETPKWIEAVRQKYGEDSYYYATGYCFGGPFSTEVASSDNVLAAAFAHPGFVTEDAIRKVKKPLLICAAESDFAFPTPARHKAELILAEIKATYHIQVYSGVEHGFATRGNLWDDNARWGKEQAASSVVTWFNRFTPKA